MAGFNISGGGGTATTQESTLQEVSDKLGGVVSAVNSSTTPLVGGAVFTGAAVEITDFSAICVAAATDQASATNGLSMQFSPDGTNWDHKHEFTVGVNGVSFTQAAELRYFRIVYTNGATPQAYFRLTTILKAQQTSPSRYTVEQALTGGQMADVTKSVIFGKTTGGGSYVDVKVNPSGALTVEATLAGIDAALDGQRPMATSLPVVIASDQSAIAQDLTKVGGAAIALGQAAMANSLPVTIANNQTAIPEDLTKVGGSAISLGQKTSANSLPVVLPSDQSIKIDQTTPGTTNGVFINNDLNFGAVGASTIRTAAQIGNATGAAAFGAGTTTAQVLRTVLASDQAPTSAAQAWVNKITDGTNTAAVKAASTAPAFADPALVVTISPNTFNPSQAGRNKVQQLFNDYSLTPVSTAAYTQLTASSTAAVNKIEIFDSSGEALILAVGGAGSEVDQLYIFPGGNGAVDLAIPASSRISVKAKTATASSGFLAINLYS